MKKYYLIALALIPLCIGCSGGNETPVVEGVTLFTSVGDNGKMVDGFEIKVSNPRSIRGLKASDFDLVNNVGGGFIDPSGGPLEDYEDDQISVVRKGGSLKIAAKPFNAAGKRDQRWRMSPWKLVCLADSSLNVTPDKVTETRTEVIDDCITGSFTYAGITREYMLYLPKDKKGNPIPNVPLLVWQIGGGEYDQPLMTAATANRCLVSLPTQGEQWATLVFAIANPNYYYSASLYPERIELIDRNNALQMAFIDTLIKEGKVDGSRLFCAGASSGGGCTMRFMMQFPDRFRAAIPCCPMDPIVPIHKVEEKYDGQFVDDLEKAFQGDVYKWDGQNMVPSPIDTKAFVALPMHFVHGVSDQTCLVKSSYSYMEARERLGAKDDVLTLYDDATLQTYGIPAMISHFSWVPLLDDYSEGSPMDWMLKK